MGKTKKKISKNTGESGSARTGLGEGGERNKIGHR